MSMHSSWRSLNGMFVVATMKADARELCTLRDSSTLGAGMRSEPYHQ